MEPDENRPKSTKEQTSAADDATDLALAPTGGPVAIEAMGGLGRLRASARAKLFGGEAPAMTIGRYAVVRRLGSGGMGAVYEAFDPQLERRAAVKVILGHEHPELVQRLIREARAMARLSHPNIAHVYEVGEFEGQAFIAMELIDGTTLRQWSAERPRSWREVVEMYIGAGRGLAAAHRAGIVHRDFKPDNVMVDREGRPRVLDFGLAYAERLVEAPTSSDEASLDLRTQAGAIMGTPAYMAPEQFAGGRSDARTDQFAFAVALFEALTGERPFAGKTFETLAASVRRGEIAMNDRALRLPRAVMGPLRVALRPEPQARHASLDAFLAALERALRGSRRTAIGAGLGLAMLAAGGVLLARTSEVSTAVELEEPPPRWLASSNLPELLPVAHPDDRLGVTIHRLSNGLTVYIAPRHDLPRVRIRTVVRAGFADESTPQSGVARLVATVIQHGSDQLGTVDTARERPLLQREAELYARYTKADATERAELAGELRKLADEAAAWARPDEIASIYHELGIEFDVEVTPDATIFAADVPSNRLDTWAEIEAEKLVRPAFRGFAEAAAKTIERARTQPPSLVAHARAAMYAGHSRSGGAFGSEAALANLPFEEVQRFHAQWYRPNNAAIVLVGDVDPQRIVGLLEQAFGAWEPRDLVPSVPPNPRVPEEPVVVKHRGAEKLAVVWPRDPGWLPSELELLFEQLLRTDTEDVFFVGQKIVQTDAVAAVVEAGDPAAAVQREIFEVVDDLSSHPLDDETITEVWDELLHERSLELGDSKGAADRIASVYANELSWRDEVEFLYEGPPGPVELQAAAARMFATAVVVHVDPGEANETPAGPSPLAWARVGGSMGESPSTRERSARAQALLQAPVSPIEPKFLVRGRDYRFHDSRMGPVVTTACEERAWIEHTYELGAEEALGCVGLSSALGQLLPVAAIEAFGDAAPTEISVNCSSNERVSSLTLTTSGLASNFDEIWLDPALWLERAAVEPQPFEPDAVDIRTLMRRLWQVRLHDDADVLHALHALGERPSILEGFAREMVPDLSSPENRLLALLRRPHTTAYCGPEPERVERGLGTHSGELRPPSRRPDEALPMRYLGVDRPGAPEFDAMLRYAVEPRSTAFALVFQEYMAGPRLGLLTGAMPGLRVGAIYGEGAVALRIAGPSHLGPQSLPALQRALSAPPDRERFEAAKAVVEERLRADWLVGPAIPQAVLRWYADGHLVDPRAETWRDLAMLRFEDLEAVLGELAGDPRQVSLVGSRRAFENEGHWSTVQWR